MGTCPHQVLAATLTLSQPGGGADYAHPILVSTPSFEGHRRACTATCSEDRGTADRGQKSRTAFALDSSSLHQQHQ